MARQPGFSGVTFEGYVGFKAVLNAAPWASVPVPDALLTGTLDPAAALGLSVLPTCRLLLLRAVKVASDVALGSPPTADLDTVWDNAQIRLDLLIAAAQRSSVPAEKSAALRLRAALLPGVGTHGATQMTYLQEVAYGRAQEVQAAKPDVHADVVLLGLTSAVAEASSATRALGDAVGASAGTARKKTVHAEQVTARRACNHAFSIVHDMLLSMLAITTDGPQRVTAEAMFQTLADLLSWYPLRPTAAPATTPTHPTATTPATPTGNADVTIVPAGTATPTTPVTPGAAAPQAPVQAPVTAPTAPRRARKTPKATHTPRAPSTAKPVRKPTKKTPAAAKKLTKKK